MKLLAPIVNVPGKIGVPVNVGEVKTVLDANTNGPVPTSLVTAAAKLALDGVPRKAATPAPKAVIPVPP